MIVFIITPTPVPLDSRGVICIARNQVFHERINHIDMFVTWSNITAMLVISLPSSRLRTKRSLILSDTFPLYLTKSVYVYLMLRGGVGFTCTWCILFYFVCLVFSLLVIAPHAYLYIFWVDTLIWICFAFLYFPSKLLGTTCSSSLLAINHLLKWIAHGYYHNCWHFHIFMDRLL